MHKCVCVTILKKKRVRKWVVRHIQRRETEVLEEKRDEKMTQFYFKSKHFKKKVTKVMLSLG